ncbi:hypothetical protein DEU56DRAFT_896768 [Suillus clintonianus]|uniref:uncharacterized protein n=1 Tax=Suillus clintonianus TaxID=1904413 RepID=UPI001B87B8A0|nr:uncharacterized protein DEU56DRAFT_896768 [Suillus clintonianus]KAG2156982.1 hypothetical protein DEU56DRAFT_896768 [Suillus clintonianus]
MYKTASGLMHGNAHVIWTVGDQSDKKRKITHQWRWMDRDGQGPKAGTVSDTDCVSVRSPGGADVDRRGRMDMEYSTCHVMSGFGYFGDDQWVFSGLFMARLYKLLAIVTTMVVVGLGWVSEGRQS